MIVCLYESIRACIFVVYNIQYANAESKLNPILIIVEFTIHLHGAQWDPFSPTTMYKPFRLLRLLTDDTCFGKDSLMGLRFGSNCIKINIMFMCIQSILSKVYQLL